MVGQGNPTRLAIFADGNRKIGLGHLTRMRSLVRWTGTGATLITRTPQAAEAVFAEEDVTIVTIPAAQKIAEAVEEHAPVAKAVVVDPPIHAADPAASSGPAWQPIIDALRARGRAVIRFTDEPSPTAHTCDLLVNDHPLARDFAGNYCQVGQPEGVLAGPRFFLIDPAHDVSAEPHDGLFVSFGGSDQSGIIQSIKMALLDFSRRFLVHVVVGHDVTIDVESSENFVVHRFLAPGDFARLLAGARVTLTASGNTLFERAYHQVPGISVAQFSHQDTIGWAFGDLGITRHLGLGQVIAPDAIIGAARALIDDPDGRSSQKKASRRLDIRGGCAEIVRGVSVLQ